MLFRNMEQEGYNVGLFYSALDSSPYREFPEYYHWIKGKKVWQIRKQTSGQIGQIVYANLGEGERYFLRVLLNHVRGAT